MKIGVQWNSFLPPEEGAAALRAAGVDATMLLSEIPDAREVLTVLPRYGILCENLHAPFDGINAIWRSGEAGEEMLRRLSKALRLAAEFSVPSVVVHLSSKTPMPQITPLGEERLDALVSLGASLGVRVVFENQRFLENLTWAMERFPTAGFCWDTGHEHCFTEGIEFLPRFGKRLAVLHVHDNRCLADRDEHLLPFDGAIDFEKVARQIAATDYRDSLMLEVFRSSKRNGESIYSHFSPEEFYCEAAGRARRLAEMVEKARAIKI